MLSKMSKIEERIRKEMTEIERATEALGTCRRRAGILGRIAIAAAIFAALLILFHATR